MANTKLWTKDFLIISTKNFFAYFTLATSTFFIFTDGGFGIGPFILGFMIPVIHYRGLYILMGFVVFSCAFIYYFYHGRIAGKVDRLNEEES
jgi:hypothetical protein